MPTQHEHEIRDLLAKDLEILEPGLKPVDTEHHVPNSRGTRGFIDILARDRHGMWVVLELKRSDSTARQALHEVAKYTELLSGEMGIRADQVRSIIVSTTWNELLTPASNLARSWEYDLRGYELIVDRQGRLSRAEPVEFLAAPADHSLTPVHCMDFYRTPGGRDDGWRRVVQYAEQIGAYDIAAVDFDYVGPPGQVLGDYALYFAIGTMNPEDIALHDGPISGVEGDEPPEEQPPDAQGHPLEYRALCHICNKVWPVTRESVSPDRFTSIKNDPTWQKSAVRRAGIYKRGTAIQDDDIVQDMSGNHGGARVRFTGSANPRIRSQWEAFVWNVTESLAGNAPWTQLMRFWFEEVSRHPTDSDVLVHVYNPCDLIQTLVYGLSSPGALVNYAPSVLGFALRKDAVSKGVLGNLYWDGNAVPDLLARVRLVYPHPHVYLAHRFAGDVWDVDQDLVSLLGLRYVLVETESD